ncbi:MAG TPA: alkaline phytoceramidase, partial [Thermoanaerobaculia bacterium]|nr:alkaline phytoceramidase [Thermoanaerobaculia bacterium]
MHPRFLLLLALAILTSAIVFATVPPIPQDQAYHHFADTRAIGPVPNGWNVLSNLGFLFAGLAGLMMARRLEAASVVLFIGVIATAFGSGAYHWFTNDAWLVWDRVGMAIAFGGFFALVIEDRIGWPNGAVLPVALALVNIMTIVVWRTTGDLRAYG